MPFLGLVVSVMLADTTQAASKLVVMNEPMLEYYEDDTPGYALVLRSIVDKRTPRSYVKEENPEVMLEYPVDEIKGQNIDLLVAPVFAKVWPSRQATEPVLEVEMVVNKMRMYIARGSLGSTRGGRYVVELEADMLFVTPEGRKIASLNGLSYTKEANRYFIKGRQPSTVFDDKKLKSLLEEALYDVAVEVDKKMAYQPSIGNRISGFFARLFD